LAAHDGGERANPEPVPPAHAAEATSAEEDLFRPFVWLYPPLAAGSSGGSRRRGHEWRVYQGAVRGPLARSCPDRGSTRQWVCAMDQVARTNIRRAEAQTDGHPASPPAGGGRGWVLTIRHPPNGRATLNAHGPTHARRLIERVRTSGLQIERQSRCRRNPHPSS